LRVLGGNNWAMPSPANTPIKLAKISAHTEPKRRRGVISDYHLMRSRRVDSYPNLCQKYCDETQSEQFPVHNILCFIDKLIQLTNTRFNVKFSE
jgi:hypothetical protein